jgi:methylated-DNA-[protein]-cysteine S-methyltransferase
MTSSLPDPASLRRALDASPELLRHLQHRLAERAAGDGVLDVAYRTIDTPVGGLLLAATTTGLVRVAFAGEGHDAILQDLADRISPRVLRHPARLDTVARQLDEYFARRRHQFDVRLDWRLVKGFRADVLHCLADIAYGRTATYATLARMAGRPAAVRAVGTACATNPLPVVVPCHRVVRSDGTIGGYLGGAAAKTALLQLEARPDARSDGS